MKGSVTMSNKCLQKVTQKCIIYIRKAIGGFRFFNYKEKEVNNMIACKGKYSALDIARYVINKYNENNVPISNLKLQKILYFIQAEFISVMDNVCFNEKMEAWAYGPVVPDVYREFKWYGSNQIPCIKTKEVFDLDTFSFKKVNVDDSFLDKFDKETIDNVINDCINYSASQLVAIAHSQSPWIDAIKRNKHEITESDMRKEFSN